MSKRKGRKSLDSIQDSPQSGIARQSYTPVIDLAPDSPLRVQGNLTGIPRKLKDLAADWYNAEVKWKNSCYNGFQIASKIGNLKVPSFDDGPRLPDSLLPLVEELLSVINNLSDIVDKMKKWAEFTQGIQDLMVEQGTSHKIIFQTWRVSRFVDASHHLQTAFTQELKVKRSVYENICHCRSRSELMFMMAAWSHDVYLDNDILFNIQAMASETGHS